MSSSGVVDLRLGDVPHGRMLKLDDGRNVFVRMVDGDEATPPTLLLHGLGATAALNWASCFGPLSRSARVFAPDLRGHGRGQRVGNHFRLVDCADDAAAILRAAGSTPAVVVGYSMGGPIAQLLALRHPDLVAGLVLCATARDFRGRPADRLRFAALGMAATTARVGPAALAPAVPLPGRWRRTGWAVAEVRRHEPSAVLAAAAALGRFTSRDWIGLLDVPATVIVHTQDKVVPTRRQRRLADAMADAEVVDVDLDHMGVARQGALYAALVARARRAVLLRARSTAPHQAAATG